MWWPCGFVNPAPNCSQVVSATQTHHSLQLWGDIALHAHVRHTCRSPRPPLPRCVWCDTTNPTRRRRRRRDPLETLVFVDTDPLQYYTYDSSIDRTILVSCSCVFPPPSRRWCIVYSVGLMRREIFFFFNARLRERDDSAAAMVLWLTALLLVLITDLKFQNCCKKNKCRVITEETLFRLLFNLPLAHYLVLPYITVNDRSEYQIMRMW